MSGKPFAQGRFEDLPEVPRRPHGWLQQTVFHLEVVSGLLGRTRVAVREVGEGPPLVLVHGLMTAGYSWRYVVDALATRWRVIVPDLPGAGETLGEGPFTATALAEWLGVFLDAADARGAPVVGNSMGGYVALHLALMDPDAMGRLLVTHAPGVVTPRLRALHAAMRVPGASSLLGAMVARDPERWVHRNVHYRDESLKSREEARVYAEPLRSAVGRAGFASWLRDGLDVGTMGRFQRSLRRRVRRRQPLGVPVRLLYATTDPMVPPSVGRQLAKLLPDAELVWMEDTSHFMHVDTPEAFLAASVPWLGGADGSA